MIKKSRRKNSYYTVLIIPEHEAATRKIKVRVSWLSFALTVVAFLFITVTYFFVENIDFLKKASKYDDIVIENKKLSNDARRIDKLFTELQKLRVFRERTRKTLSSTNQLSAINSDIALADTVIEFLKNTSPDEEKYLNSIGSLYESVPSRSPIVAPIVSRGFEQNLESKTGHLGIDLVTSTGSPVMASASGTVIFSDWTNKFGYIVIIRHPHDYISVYKHNQNVVAIVGQHVRQGNIIAFVGNSGSFSTGVHCHFEIWKSGRAINPALLVAAFK